MSPEHSYLFVFGAGLVVGGAVVYLLYTKIAVAAAELKAKVDAFENAFGTLKADISGAGAAVTATVAALKAPATVGPIMTVAPAASAAIASSAPAATPAAPAA